MMQSKENYTPHIFAAFSLTVTVLIIFQIYIIREPDRIERQEAADQAVAVAEGRVLYAENCEACHGMFGEGGVGPALNSRQFLNSTPNEALFQLTRTGIPGTIMPAWGQAFGGPLTDEQAGHLVTFIRAWEPTAPEIEEETTAPDPILGAAIYQRTCFVCHGEHGSGTENSPTINDPRRLSRFDDNWYRNVIIRGRPAKGMPTWGTVLSPAQINDLIALIGVWREGGIVTAEVSLATYLSNALYAVRDFDPIDAIYYLNGALEQADEDQAVEIQEIIDLIGENQLFLAEGRITSLLPPEEMGQAVYITNCSSCHGIDGTGDMGPNLHNNAYLQSNSDDALVTFLLQGRSGTPMDGFEGILAEDELRNLIAFLREWEE